MGNAFDWSGAPCGCLSTRPTFECIEHLEVEQARLEEPYIQSPPYFTRSIRKSFGEVVARFEGRLPAGTLSSIAYHPHVGQLQRSSSHFKNHGILEQASPPNCPSAVHGTLTCLSSQLRVDDLIYHLTTDDQEEIDDALKIFKSRGLEWTAASRETFSLPRLGVKLDRICDKLYHGAGFEVVRGLDVAKYGPEDLATIFLGLSRYIGADCATQDPRGTNLKHIMDDHPIESQNDLPFHTDVVCDVIALLAVQCSDHGGTTTLASACAVYNEIASTRPDVITTLMKPDWPFDTYSHDPPYYYRAPLYVVDGKAIFSFSRRLLAGHPSFGRTHGVPMLSEAQAEAIDLVHFTAQKLQVRIPLQQGDIRFINNFAALHGRESYKDADEAFESKRHILRLWLRNQEMQWKLPADLQMAWARIFDDPERLVRWDFEPVFEGGQWQGRGLISECN